MDYCKSSSGRVVYTISEGRLSESSPDFDQFTLTAGDTQILLDLFMRNEKEIRKAAEREQTLPAATRVRHQ